MQFQASCVALSRPCLLKGMAYSWPALSKWTYLSNGYTYLESDEVLGKASLNVFKAVGVSDDDEREHKGNSFPIKNYKATNYKAWLKQMSDSPFQHALRHEFEDNTPLKKEYSSLMQDVILPDFYDNYHAFKSVELT